MVRITPLAQVRAALVPSLDRNDAAFAGGEQDRMTTHTRNHTGMNSMAARWFADAGRLLADTRVA
jgi:hypothetical protein